MSEKVTTDLDKLRERMARQQSISLEDIDLLFGLIEDQRRQVVEARQRAHDIANDTAPLQLELTMAKDDLKNARVDAAALKEALVSRHTCENCGGKGSYWTDVDGEAEHEVCDCWIEADKILEQEHAGAALLAELEAARALVNALRMHRDLGGEVWHSIDADFATYDAAVEAREG